MELHSGSPYWIVRNGLLADLPTLKEDLPNEDIVIIGSGISGALVAHELSVRGVRCTMIDSRMLSSGSTWASTAQLNYELDTSLVQLSEWYGESMAAAVYHSSLESVDKLHQVLIATNTHASYHKRSSLYLASDKKAEKSLRKESELRHKNGIPCDLVEEPQLRDNYKSDYRLALHHNHAAELDSYRAAAGIIRYHSLGNGLKVFTHTRITKMQSGKDGVRLLTDSGHTIHAKKVVCAAGYEAASFLPKTVARLESTFALVTAPVSEELLWNEKSLIWETARPYFYLRTTPENRIMAGGEDIIFKNALLRDNLMAEKTEKLLKRCRTLLPWIEDLQLDFSWCGTFAETDDGLPYIGGYPGLDHVYFALGYGGNGTTFSMQGAEIIANSLFGTADARAALYGFDRKRH